MSMPQSINIAIVCSDLQKINYIKSNIEFSSDRPAPIYFIVSPDDKINSIVNPKNYPYGFVEQWISLDEKSKRYCVENEEINKKNPNFSRGFYDELLPDSIMEIEEDLPFETVVQKLKVKMKKILVEFCRTS